MGLSATKSVDEAAYYTPVLPASTCVPPPPRFSFGTFPGSVAASYYETAPLHGIGVYTGEHLRWSDGFVSDDDGALLLGSHVHLRRQLVDELGSQGREGFLGRPVERLTGNAAVLVPPGTGYGIYGHWLVDMLPKLAVLHAAGHDLASLWYPVPNDTPSFGLELMTLFGVPKVKIVKVAHGHAVAADKLLMSTSLHNGLRFSPLLRDAVALFRAGIARAGAPAPVASGPARIFLARSTGNRKLTNRERVEAMARSAGFDIVRPEERTLAEQVALFSSAREILGEYGSAFHTAMFSPPGTVVCGLRGSRYHPAFIQSGIGDVLGQPTGYVFGEQQGDPAKHDYSVAEEAVSDCLKIVFSREAGLAVGATVLPARPAMAVSAPAPRDASGHGQAAQRGKSAWRRVIARWPFRRRPAAVVARAEQAPGKVRSPSLFDSAPAVYLMGHLQNRGDTEAGLDGWLTTPGRALAIEGVKISFGTATPDIGLNYQVLRGDGGMSEPVRCGLFCGTRGKGVPIFGLLLQSDAALSFGVTVEGYFQNGSYSRPVGVGEILCATSPSPLTALRVITTLD